LQVSSTTSSRRASWSNSPPASIEDLLTATRERLDQLTRDALEIGVTVVHLAPRDAERPGELVAQMGLIEDTGRLGVQEDPS